MTVGKTCSISELSHIEAVIERFFLTASAQDLMEDGQARGLAIMALGKAGDLLSDPQLTAEHFFTSLRHQDLNDAVLYPGAPGWMTSPATRTGSPSIFWVGRFRIPGPTRFTCWSVS